MVEELEGHITVNEAARRMDRSTEQVRRYLREGKLPGKRIGGQWFIRETALLYRTRQEETSEMMRKEAGPAEDLPDRVSRAPLEVFESINRRRDDIRRRWDKLGIEVDAVALIREMRDEEP